MTMPMLVSVVGDADPVGYGVGAGGGSAGSGYTYADRAHTITTTQNWQTRVNSINSSDPGSSGSPTIIGVEAGTHSGSNVRNVQPHDWQYFIGETDGVATTQFPNGTPTTIIDGQENGSLDTGSRFLAEQGENVVIENLEVKNFASPHGGGDTFGGDSNTDNWLIYNCHIHHVQRAIKFGATYTRVAHCLIEYCYNASFHASSWEADPGPPPVKILNGGGVIEDCTVRHINTDQDPWNLIGAGASTKFAGGCNQAYTIRFNRFEDHYGPAIWFDAYLHASLEQQHADIHHNNFVDNLYSFMWEIMGRRGQTPKVGVDFHDNRIEYSGVLFGDAYERLRPIFVTSSIGTSTYPIKINDNLFVYNGPHRSQMASALTLASEPSRGEADWVEFQRNTVTDNGTLGPDPADTEYVVGLFDWAVFDGLYLEDRNITIDLNDYTYNETVLGGLPFYTKTAKTWSAWQTVGFDTNGSYTAL